MLAGRRYRLGRAYESQRRWDKAEQTYRAILASDDPDPQALFRLGVVLERQHRWPEAADAYRSALAIEERNKWLMRLGKVLERSSRDEAREVYEKLLARDPKTTELDRRLLKADLEALSRPAPLRAVRRSAPRRHPRAGGRLRP